MSYVMSEIEAQRTGALQLGLKGGAKVNEASGIATFASTPEPSAVQPTIKTAAKLNPVAQRYVAKGDPRDIGVRSWICANRATAHRSPGLYRTLRPRHEPALRPAATPRPNRGLLRSVQQTAMNMVQQKIEAPIALPKEIAVAVTKLAFNPIRQAVKTRSMANGPQPA
jgi:hypothetical protein